MDENTKTILIIEDDNALRNVLTEKLSAEGFNIIQAVNGEEGLEVALREHPALILLDILMPKLDGLSMLTKMRGGDDPWAKHVPVMVLTNSTDAQTIYRATNLGASDFLIKSEWSLDAITEKVRERLG
jgi:DNA-binding response OmpR family regulator